MENKKSILAGSVIASAIMGLSNIGANAATLTNYSVLGSGAEVRTVLLGNTASNLGAFELKCSAGKDSAKTKGKDAKCGKGKKDGKCGEGKCGKDKKATPAK